MVSILVNGQEGKKIVCKKGLRQGDPLSPLLFVLVADTLNFMTKKDRERNVLDGSGVTKEANSIINLHYADDTLLFGQYDTAQAAVLKCILLCFKNWS